MKREELTSDGVAQAIVRIQQAAQGSASGRFRTCLQELTDLQECLTRGETPDLGRYPEGLAALDFVAQLERSSLGTPAAKGLRARTGAETMRRIARHRQELDAEETKAQPGDEHAADAASGDLPRFRSRVRTYLEKRLKHQHGEESARAAGARTDADWSVRTDREAKIPEVTCTVQFGLVVSDASPLPLPAELRYRPTDPYAIEATFHTGLDEHVSWVFARETVAAGLRTHAGAGDVKIWPRNGSSAETICISLGSPEGMAVLEVPRAALQTFLRRTNDLVLPGTEWQHVDIDGAFDLTTLQVKEDQRQTRTD